MKHLKKFNEDVDNTLEPQDLLDFSQDIVDAGYTVKYYIFGSVITPDDIISDNEKSKSFDIYYGQGRSGIYKGILKIEISDFPISDFQKVITYMESFKRHIDEYSFVLDKFDCETGVSEDANRNTIIKKLEYIFKEV
jgi:hypothetical protein